MNKRLRVFLASLVVFPLLVFGIFMCFVALLAFITWEWYTAFHMIDYLVTFRVCCVIGWVLSVAFIKDYR